MEIEIFLKSFNRKKKEVITKNLFISIMKCSYSIRVKIEQLSI